MRLSTINTGISRFLFHISTAGIIFVLAVVFCNVIARYIFNSPFHWAEEITSVTLILLGFFPAAELWRKGSHIKFDLLSQRLSIRFPRSWRIVDTVICLMGILFSAILLWETIKNTYTSYIHNMREPSILGTPLWILYLFMLLGSAALLLAFINTLIRIFKGESKSQ